MPIRHATIVFLLAAASARCSMITNLQMGLRDSTDAINKSSAAIATNTEYVKESTATTASMVPALRATRADPNAALRAE